MKKILGISFIIIVVVLIAWDISQKNKPIITDTNIQPNVADVNPQNTTNPPVELIGPHQVPANTIVFNNNIATPDGSNKFPIIAPPTPTNTTTVSQIAPPPEVAYMTACRNQANGNPELLRKCLESSIAINVSNTAPTIQSPGVVTMSANQYMKAMNEKIAYCKSQSGNNTDAFKFCVNTYQAPLVAQPSPSEFIHMAKSGFSANQAVESKQAQNNNPNNIFK